jgi:type VI secretion system protein ImpA
LAQLIAVQNTHAEFETLVDRAFGADAPSLRSMRDAIAGCVDLANRLAVRTGAKAQPAPVVAPLVTPDTDSVVTQPERPAMNAPQFSGPIQSRSEAVNQLREIARFFRDTEPHSPVALLADRAARWAEMPLEQWLSTVIKDDATLGQLRELLDWERDGESS